MAMKYEEAIRRERIAKDMRWETSVNCLHAGEKKIDGNKIICCKCGRVAGFVRDPRKVLG